MPSLVALRSESRRAALSARSQTPVRLPGVASSKSFGAETSNRVLTDHAWTGKAMSTMPTGPFIKRCRLCKVKEVRARRDPGAHGVCTSPSTGERGDSAPLRGIRKRNSLVASTPTFTKGVGQLCWGNRIIPVWSRGESLCEPRPRLRGHVTIKGSTPRRDFAHAVQMLVLPSSH